MVPQASKYCSNKEEHLTILGPIYRIFAYNLVDCPTQLTLVTWICQLSRRWGPFKRGSKIFGAFLQPGKDI